MNNIPIKYCIFTLALLAALFLAAGYPAMAASAPVTTWENHYGGSNIQSGQQVWQTSDKGFIIVGTAPSSDGSYSNLLLIKTDSAGNQQWSNPYGASANTEGLGYSVRQTSDGGYIAAGADSDDLYMVKTDSSGNKQWDKVFKNASSDQTVGYSVQQTSDGGYIIAGRVAQAVDNWNIYLLKTDASGNKQWETYYGGSDINCQANSVWQTFDGGYILAGTASAGNNPKPFLLKADANGKVAWYKSYEGADQYDNFEGDWCGVQQTRDGGYIYAGSDGGNSYLLKTDASGNKQWDKTYEVAGFNSVQQAWDNGYVMTGVQRQSESPDKILVVRTDSSGNEQWSNTYASLGTSEGFSVLQIGDGSFVVAGTTSANSDSNNNVYLGLIAKDMTPVPNSKLTSDSIPTTWNASQAYSVSVTFENTGTMPWTFQDNTTFGHSGDADKFGVTGPNQTIQIGKVIRPGQSETFTFTMTAPKENGTYNPQFQMMWEGRNVFGALDNKTIKVVNGTGPAVETATTAASVQATVQPSTSAAASAAPTESQATAVPTATSKPKGGLPCLSSLVLPVLAIGIVTVSWTMNRKRGSK